jgi:hypothetical protein
LEGLKFRRQHSIGMYIVDFYCSKYKLAIELDGNYHFEETQMIRDDERDKFLSEVGIKVIRIENQNVFKNIDMVLIILWRMLGVDGFLLSAKVNHPLSAKRKGPLLYLGGEVHLFLYKPGSLST